MRATLATIILCAAVARASAAEPTFDSAATGQTLAGRLLVPTPPPTGPAPTVVYLKNLSVPRLGREPDEPILRNLTASGYVVLVLDYRKHPKAVSPNLNADVLKIREAVAGKHPVLLADRAVDVDRLFILPEGFRLRRDVEFARDGERVLAMDVIYPSQPERPVPALMEVTCDNVNRMGAASLLFCRDTLLEGGALAGFAVAMADHPVAPPYNGIDDPYPQVVDRMKAAAATLRELADACHLSGKIGAIGFSRGGPMAALLAARGRDDVQAALVHGNYYDYLAIPHGDRMYPRFEKAWGPRELNRERWATHGAAHHLTKDAAPMFLNTSDSESPEFRAGLDALHRRLADLGVEHVYQVDADDRGHRVTTNPDTLARVYAFFREHLR